IPDAMSRPYVQNGLSNKMLEVMSWGLMEAMTAENDCNQHIRRFLNILLGDDPDTAHLELIDNYNIQEAALYDQLLQLVHESLSRSDEFLYRMSESRDRIALVIEQKSQLKHHLDKIANSSAEAVAAVQDLMRDTALLFDQACRLNSQLLHIDALVSDEDTRAQLKMLEERKAQYKASLERARNLARGLADSAYEQTSSEGGDNLASLQTERDLLFAQALDKSEQIRKLLDCVRQMQLTSAQLLHI
ncbi:hypothetical protein GGI09_008574, partial [Coemansia sp. S100]